MSDRTPEEVAEYRAKKLVWYHANKEKRSQYFQKNKVRLVLEKTARRKSNILRYRETERIRMARIYKNGESWYHLNKDKFNADRRSKRASNKEASRKQINEYFQNRKATDLNFKVRCSLRSCMTNGLRRRGIGKSLKTEELVGCSLKELQVHIESLWKPGMSWGNRGVAMDQWQIDHIWPCASFDLSNPSEQKKCFNYTNLQPLWTWQNQAKKDKLDYVWGDQ